MKENNLRKIDQALSIHIVEPQLPRQCMANKQRWWWCIILIGWGRVCRTVIKIVEIVVVAHQSSSQVHNQQKFTSVVSHKLNGPAETALCMHQSSANTFQVLNKMSEATKNWGGLVALESHTSSQQSEPINAHIERKPAILIVSHTVELNEHVHERTMIRELQLQAASCGRAEETMVGIFTRSFRQASLSR